MSVFGLITNQLKDIKNQFSGSPYFPDFALSNFFAFSDLNKMFVGKKKEKERERRFEEKDKWYYKMISKDRKIGLSSSRESIEWNLVQEICFFFKTIWTIQPFCYLCNQ